MWLSGLRTTTQELFDPLGRNSITTMHSAKERSSYSGIRVGVPAAHDGICHPIL